MDTSTRTTCKFAASGISVQCIIIQLNIVKCMLCGCHVTYATILEKVVYKLEHEIDDSSSLECTFEILSTIKDFTFFSSKCSNGVSTQKILLQ